MNDDIALPNEPRLDVVIPGAQKAGTTSLLNSLGEHPAVLRHTTTEFGELLKPDSDLTRAVATRIPAGSGMRLAKSAGFMYSPGGFDRLHAHNPDARLIFMLREPVSRMYSAFWFAKRTGHEPIDSFEEALAAEESRVDQPHVAYRRRSQYLAPLREAAATFGTDHIRIVLLEEYRAHRLDILGEVQTWLGLEVVDLGHTPAVSNPAAVVRSERLATITRSRGTLARTARRLLPRSLVSGARRTLVGLNEQPQGTPQLEEALRDRLSAEFAEHNSALADEFDLDLSSWAT